MLYLSIYRQHKYLLNLLVLMLILSFVVGCQLSPELNKTRDFDEEESGFYIHQLKNHNNKDTLVLIDGEPVNDFLILDQSQQGADQMECNYYCFKQ